MKNKKAIRSPLFYVGDKYKLMPQLKELFPKNINSFFDVFCGGGSVSINTQANQYFLNDVNEKVIELHSLLMNHSADMEKFILYQYKQIEKYGLSHSEFGLNEEIEKLKRDFKKTYFSKYNKESYLALRASYNSDQSDVMKLYLLLIYGFNHMIRFNNSGQFNLPVGNVDWNKNVTQSLINYSEWTQSKNNNVNLTSLDFEEFVNNQKIGKNDFLYFDPPYLITFSDYNKLWSLEEELRLYNLLDRLDQVGIKWGLSNMVSHKGKTNKFLIKWAQKYNEYSITSNYISRFDNTIKENSKEIYVTNV
ncbi:Dam family site-specific DNA-(adenine-N6)-methyltransferase [Streptococcus gallolyticus subsp. gallolyticus]|uniref:DNA adenine methylase n=1 Tax=Streptococcus gallolyticus TaxID=315405 RepID=UPI002284592B|nr:Dam family site-specific DNA-(adenine-N6)-methyltransferase [Streptococcus gallolyticus]MCY7201842.1 Dam family site-specific DNA-(adenine-N6)-methyltransferase [Streptococcus gallolyticus subsp. gallolyticus]